MKSMLLNRLKKLLVYRIKVETKKPSIILFDLTWKYLHQVTHFFCHFEHVYRQSQKHCNY